MANRQYIKIGTQCNTRFGTAKVTGIELCNNGAKYGIALVKVFIEDKYSCTYNFDHGHYQYGAQVTALLHA